MSTENSFTAPPFDPGRHVHKPCFVWWSWHPNYPYWSRSCWKADSEVEAWALLGKKNAAMRRYHNKLIFEAGGRFTEVADLLPMDSFEEWYGYAQGQAVGVKVISESYFLEQHGWTRGTEGRWKKERIGADTFNLSQTDAVVLQMIVNQGLQPIQIGGISIRGSSR